MRYYEVILREDQLEACSVALQMLSPTDDKGEEAKIGALAALSNPDVIDTGKASR